MTAPRRLLPDQLHAITRRTARRAFFLKPSEFVNAVVLYALGLALQGRELVEVIGFMVLANHYHLILRDVSNVDEDSQVPDLIGHMNSLIARALNTHYGRGENFWAPESYGSVEVWGEASLESQLLYLWTNPVRDGMVPRPEQWPGTKFLPEDLGTTIEVRKPEGAFFGGRGKDQIVPTDPYALEHWLVELSREQEAAVQHGRERDEEKRKKGKGPSKKRQRELDRQRANRVRNQYREGPQDSDLPETVTIEIAAPREWLGESSAEETKSERAQRLQGVRTYFRERLEEELDRVHAARKAAGKHHYMGVEEVLAQDPRDAAGSTWPTFATNPRVSCKGPVQVRLQVLETLVQFRLRYRQAYAARQKGEEGVVFPLGTYRLRRYERVHVRGATGPPIAA